MSLVKTPREVIELIDREKIEVVDLRFTDLAGQWRQFSVPSTIIDEDSFENGLGSGESELLVKPVPDTGFIDPFLAHRTLVLICDIRDPLTGADSAGDPRAIARRAEAWLKGTGLADSACFGPEVEFFVFDDVRFDQGANFGFYHVEPGEGRRRSWRDDESGPGREARLKQGRSPARPADDLQDLCSEMMLTLMKIGIDMKAQRHDAASGGRCRLDLRFAPLTQMADNLLKFKYVVKNTARKHDMAATFMPKPLFGGNGSGMRVRFSMWKDGANLFAGKGYAGLSDTALYAIGGLLKHAPALLAISNPTTNSFKRLAPGSDAPVNLVYSSRNPTAAVRVSMHGRSEKARRLEFRCPDPSGNPYLSFAGMLMAAADGIQNRLHPGEALDEDIGVLSTENSTAIPKTPGSLREALINLKKDHDWLLKGDVFTEEIIKTWIETKLKNDVRAVEERPHPWEFNLYFDI